MPHESEREDAPISLGVYFLLRGMQFQGELMESRYKASLDGGDPEIDTSSAALMAPVATALAIFELLQERCVFGAPWPQGELREQVNSLKQTVSDAMDAYVEDAGQNGGVR